MAFNKASQTHVSNWHKGYLFNNTLRSSVLIPNIQVSMNLVNMSKIHSGSKVVIFIYLLNVYTVCHSVELFYCISKRLYMLYEFVKLCKEVYGA